jgi:very-short-patch-repair endonuclease
LKWSRYNKDWFTSKGYKYTTLGDEFIINVEDLNLSSKIKIKVICDYCKEEYETSFVNYVNGKNIIPNDCCHKCAYKKSNEIRKIRYSDKKFSELYRVCEEKEYTLVSTIDDYNGCSNKIDFICPKHGLQSMVIDNLINGHECIKCSYEKRGNILKHDVEFIKETIEKFNNNILLNKDDYKDSSTKNLKIKCGKCGNIFITSYTNYIRYDVKQCYSCSMKESKGESEVRNVLEKYNIKFVREKRFNDCRDKKPLPFDFYLPDYNLCIEFDGIHHYKETRMLISHKITLKHDNIKNNYCKNKGINLLRIPYYEYKNIENIIFKEIHKEKYKLCN